MWHVGMTKRDDILKAAKMIARAGSHVSVGPGPWTADIDANGVVHIVDANGHTVAFTSIETWESFKRAVNPPVKFDSCVTADGRWFWRQGGSG